MALPVDAARFLDWARIASGRYSKMRAATFGFLRFRFTSLKKCQNRNVFNGIQKIAGVHPLNTHP